MKLIRTWFSIACLMTWAVAMAQQPELEPQLKAAPVPTVTFTRDWPGATPEHYSISVEETGRAAYQSSGKTGPDSAPGDPYQLKFTMSGATRQRIFDLARQANYFREQVDYNRGNIANTGAKTLSYADGNRRSQATYNWSQKPPIQQITSIFENISETMESGRRLAHSYRYDKLGLDEELKKMQQAANRGMLLEIHAIQPILQQIANDPAIMRLARQRAQGLLQSSSAARTQ